MDITNTEEIAKALEPMREATNIMSEDSTPTLSLIAPLHAQLLHDTEAGGRNSNRQFMKNWPTDARSSTLHPRFKPLPFLSQDEQQDIQYAPI